jgi:hypothetical protein
MCRTSRWQTLALMQRKLVQQQQQQGKSRYMQRVPVQQLHHRQATSKFENSRLSYSAFLQSPVMQSSSKTSSGRAWCLTLR